ncbi:glutathionylspermidine synthase family protein [Bacillus horti]|uniref:Glutathionylspermidine synthase n=1 Tax=Caldalkalibacillus horti TaxID=77523 RepID=A0ABT9W1S4_9BACI|nr:glutathionylspermidine synthase family protein [Bacillus horti]MDQ0167191.1 glutathionylspermidine synthase [Bacillus horti]
MANIVGNNMSDLITTFNKYVKENEALAIEAFQELRRKTEEEDLLNINNKIPIFPRPGLIQTDHLNKLAQDTETILNIITTIPERIFNHNIKEMCSHVGLSDQHYELVKQTYGANDGLMSRCDLFFEADHSYKFLEFNVDSSVGGLEIAAVNRVMEGIELYKSWNLNNDWKYDDPLKNLISLIHHRVSEKNMENKLVTVAVIDWHTYIDGYIWSLNLIKEYLIEAGYNVIVCSQKDVELKDGYLCYQDQIIDVVYRVFLSDDALENPREIQPILDAYKENNLILLSGIHTELYSNKTIFALLSDPKYKDYYSEKEQEVIHRCIPWTRVLEDTATTYEGREVNLINFIVENQSDLVLKPALGYGGQSVTLGWNSSKEEWQKKVFSTLQSKERFIVQKRVVPVEEEMPKLDENGISFENVMLNWGIYVFDGRFSGSMLRGLTTTDHGIINAAQGASMTCVFYRD